MSGLTPDALASLLAEETDACYLPAITIDHAALPAPQRLVGNTQSVTYAGEVYVASDLKLGLATDTDETVPQARATLENISLALVEFLRSIDTPADVNLLCLRVDGNGAVSCVLGPLPQSLLHVRMDAVTIDGTLGYDHDLLNQPAVKDFFNEAVAPGLS